jgi:Spy/CpxP family protein refolding chaperone
MRTDDTHIPNTRTLKSRRSWRFLAPALAVLTLGGGVAVTAAHAQTAQQEPAEPGGEMDFGAHRLQRLLDKVNATPAQRSQIQGIWANLKPQLKANRQQRMALHRQMASAFTAPTVDASQIEQLRQQSMQLADSQSQLFTQGLVQTAQVLTQDQRKQAEAALQEARSHFHHHFGPQQPQP